jgi:hypothetical protein
MLMPSISPFSLSTLLPPKSIVNSFSYDAILLKSVPAIEQILNASFGENISNYRDCKAEYKG